MTGAIQLLAVITGILLLTLGNEEKRRAGYTLFLAVACLSLMGIALKLGEIAELLSK